MSSFMLFSICATYCTLSVLSLMIGLCILLLGRGARVAGAVRRSHRDDDGGGG